MMIQKAFAGVRKDRHHRDPKRPDHEVLQLFPFGKFIKFAKPKRGDYPVFAFQVEDLRTDYQKMREMHTGEIK